jgi:hypothetical protein
LGAFVSEGLVGRDEVNAALHGAAYANHWNTDPDCQPDPDSHIRYKIDHGLDDGAGKAIDWDSEWKPVQAKPENNSSATEVTESDDTPVLAERLLTRSDLRLLPDPMPLIDNVLDQGTTALLYGSWGTTKTFIALDWAASVATGRNWQGRATAQRRLHTASV